MTEITRQRCIYLAADFVTLNVGVLAFYVVRYFLFSGYATGVTLHTWLSLHSVLGGLLVFPAVILGISAISGYYNRSQLFYRSRLDEFINTLGVSFAGMLAVFFTAIVNDRMPGRILSYELMCALWACLFVPMYFTRLVITTITTRRLQRKGHGWRTLIAGVSPAAVKEAERLEKAEAHCGMTVIGFINPRQKHVDDGTLLNGLPVYGADYDFARLKSEIDAHAVIVMPHPSGMPSTLDLINRLYPLDLPLLIPPTLHQLITMRPRITTVKTEPLVDITNANISPRLANIKRLSDVIVASLGLIMLSPLLAAIAIAVKLDSKGPVVYRQERLGYHKKPFKILKFRTMYTDAEEHGPALSSEDDPRITRIGRTLRKYRLDELLQLWNVLVGEMSLVGPRPEREYYVRRIVKEVPAYSLIHQVRPGITSWGMVRYGYASSVEQMIERLRYDLLYLENISLGVDLKILYHTIHTVLSGKGL